MTHACLHAEAPRAGEICSTDGLWLPAQLSAVVMQDGRAEALEAVRRIFELEESFWAMAMDGPVK